MFWTRQHPCQLSLLTVLVLAAYLPGKAVAYPVEVMSSLPVETQVAPALGTINGTPVSYTHLTLPTSDLV